MLPSANPTDDPLELLPLGPKAQFYGLWLIAAVATTLFMFAPFEQVSAVELPLRILGTLLLAMFFSSGISALVYSVAAIFFASIRKRFGLITKLWFSALISAVWIHAYGAGNPPVVMILGTIALCAGYAAIPHWESTELNRRELEHSPQDEPKPPPLEMR